MSSDFWKQFPAIPGFDCVKMKHDIQARIHGETKGMTQAERLEYYRRGAQELRASRRAAKIHGAPAAVREEPATYNPKKRGKSNA